MTSIKKCVGVCVCVSVYAENVWQKFSVQSRQFYHTHFIVCSRSHSHFHSRSLFLFRCAWHLPPTKPKMHMNTFIYVINAISSPFITIVLFMPATQRRQWWWWWQWLNRYNFACAYQFICIYRDEIVMPSHNA